MLVKLRPLHHPGGLVPRAAQQQRPAARAQDLGEAEARNLLVLAFASELVERVKVEPVREQIGRALFRQIPERLPERRDIKR